MPVTVPALLLPPPADTPTTPDTLIRVLGEAPSYADIRRLELAMREMPQADLPVVHHWAPGMYARELRLPAGALIVGKLHRTEHLCVVSMGEAIVWTEAGMAQVRAGWHHVTRPGTKRVILTLSDFAMTTFHATALTDLDAIEAAIIAPELDALEALQSKEIPQ